MHRFSVGIGLFGVGLLITGCGGDGPVPPEAENGPPAIAGELGAELDEDGAAEIDVLAAASDPDGDALEAVLLSGPAHGVAEARATGFRYVPEADYNGTDAFTVAVRDGRGGQASATVGLVILPVNDRPVAAEDAAAGYEDEAMVLDVLANDVDVDGDTLAVAVVGAPGHGTAVAASGGIRYEPAPDFWGADTLRYSATDPSGAADTARVTVTVQTVDDPPVAAPDSASVPEDGSVLVDVLANDTDIDTGVLSIGSVQPGAHGTTAVEAGQVRYTPDPAWVGVDSFTYEARDGTSADTGVVTVTVTAVNQRPVAVDDGAALAEDESVVVDVLANDSDPDGDSLSIVGGIAPDHGTVAHASGTLHYTPYRNYNGTDTFRYFIDDGAGGRDTATVSVTITPVQDAPWPRDDSVTVAQDGSVLIDVLANDIDVDGDTLTLTGSIFGPGHGTVTVESEQLRYTPYPGYTGPDEIIYFVTDGIESGIGATVYITVVAADGGL